MALMTDIFLNLRLHAIDCAVRVHRVVILIENSHIGCICCLHFHGHDAPVPDKLTYHGFPRHRVKLGTPRGRLLAVVKVVPVSSAVLPRMSLNTFLRPVNLLPETVHKLKHGIVTNSRSSLPDSRVHDGFKVDLFSDGVILDFAFLNFGDNDVFV